MAALEINCPACGNEALLRREPVYEGFRKTGEALLCAGCGHRFDSEAEVPFVTRRAASVFTADERPRPVVLFSEDEKTRNCRHCVHYLKNPFTQWCALHRRETDALEVCDRFTRRPQTPPAAAGPV